MTTDKWTYRWLWSCLVIGGLLLLTGCADKSEDEPLPQPEQGSPLELRALTRTSGATPVAGSNGMDIHVFLTSETASSDGSFTYNSGTGWTSDISIKEERQYYLYGYMPKGITGSISVTADDLNNDYSKGVDLTMSNMPAITAADISVIVGVQRVETPTETVTVREGNYSYRSGIKGKNYVNLLMAHLYSKLELQFLIDEAYSQLRSIHLTDVELIYTGKNVNATVNIRKDNGIGSPTFENTGSSSEQKVEMLSGGYLELDTSTETAALEAYCAPGIPTTGTFTIKSTYEVKDKKNNSLGVRSAVNKLKITASDLLPGQKNTVTLTVKPTYLYILSDEDLDNPTITIN
jgi:hypothetical protein